MKNVLTIALIALLVWSCKTDKKDGPVLIEDKSSEDILAPISEDILESAIIYEANIRQYSPEGTFQEFTKDIPELKKLGVKIIWLMPVFPISETKRKATGGPDSKFASDFPEDEQSKYLGSYYAVTDFTKINPEFGTIEDFRELVNMAHKNSMYVILDWVPNHTGWDHEWLKTNPDYYTQNEDGEVIHPEGTDWTDVADLNYDNKSMRKDMLDDMSYWITKEGVDGFRCDVAGSVPLDFWQETIPELRKQKDIFMLAEAWEPELMKGNDLFDMAYAWDGHHLLNSLAKGEKNLKDFEAYTTKIFKDYETNDILMNFVTNHDENSWNGTIKERMGDASELMTVFSYMQKGMPLIYTGQEYDLAHRLKFFEKDSIPKVKGKTWQLLEKLAVLKQENEALHGGRNGAAFVSLVSNNEHVLDMVRKKGKSKIRFIGNFSNNEQMFNSTTSGTFVDFMTDSNIELKAGEALTLQPWEYKILIQ
ncbi:alpha-amylase family glycosyl hydrolase [uncultured Psychroserpens sp.]|uniref:alpha-amylase family glycosyl hydrolase n=1 Tax=uncultured Psychroserpens sp. TaxID=255436 RepID=UPI0026356512|nr:alpha-amylase family glycosyl hydrolase [uncultured Psychroserpens sp.]